MFASILNSVVEQTTGHIMKLNNIEAIEALLDVLPSRVSDWIRNTIKTEDLETLQEIIVDLERPLELRFLDESYTHVENLVVTASEIKELQGNIGKPFTNNRLGVPGTLHRISVLFDRNSEVVGYTIRVGRHIPQCCKIIQDLLDSNESILIMGKPGSGKTAKLRDACHYLADRGLKVMIVDTSNEIAGETPKPHYSVGMARRIMVSHHKAQAEVMIEAVENHTPDVIVIDEISNWRETEAARTIAQRGVKLIATVHGDILENLIQNPETSGLIGGAKPTTLSDAESIKVGKPKTVINRQFLPTFTKVVELRGFDKVSVHHDVKNAVDRFLDGHELRPEERIIEDGETLILRKELTGIEVKE